MAKVKITAVSSIRAAGTVYPAGSHLEIDEKQAASLIRLGAAKEFDNSVIDAEIIEDVMAEILEVVDEKQAEALTAAGFKSVEDFKEATKATLTAVEGVGDATADKILKIVKG